MQNILNKIVKYSIYASVFLLPLFFLSFSFEAFEYNKQYLLFFLVSLAFFAWVTKMVIYDKEIRFKRSPLDIFVLSFLFIALLSAVFSIDKSSSLYGFYGRFSNGLISLLSLTLFYFLITNNVVSENPKNQVKKNERTNSPITISKILNILSWSTVLLVLSTYLSIFGVWAKLNTLFALPRVMTSRIFNPVSASLEGLSVFLAIVVILLVSKILISRRQSIFTYLFLASILLLMVIIDFTAAWLVLLITLTLLVALSLWKKVFRENVNRLLLPIILIIVTALLIPLQLPKVIFGQDSATANLPREQILDQSTSWSISFGGATDSVKNAFLGSGLGTFNYDFSKKKPLDINESWLWPIRLDRSGVHLAEILGTTGFLGMISYLALLVIFLMTSYFFLKQKSQATLLLVVFAAIIVSQLVYYQNTVLAFLFWLVLGLSVVAWQKPIKEKVVSFSNFPELSLVFSTLIIILGISLFGIYFFSVKAYLADVNYAKAQTTVSGSIRNQYLEKAVRLNPSLFQYRTALAKAYLQEALNEIAVPEAERDSAKIQILVSTAINQAKIATELAPNQVYTWETLGVIYREIRNAAAGAVEWGIKSFETAISLDPNNPVLHTELGKLYMTSNQLDKAQEQFAKALDRKPDYIDALIQQTLALERQGMAKEALSKLEGLFANYPLSVDVSFHLGRIYFNNNQVQESINQFQRVIILAPDHSNAHYSLGVAYASQGQTNLAIEEFEKVLSLNPNSEDVKNKLKSLRGF
ncbi:MAG: tetratricopeptide repeat protein [Candidatus Nealsonbacteria bacterium]